MSFKWFSLKISITSLCTKRTYPLYHSALLCFFCFLIASLQLAAVTAARAWGRAGAASPNWQHYSQPLALISLPFLVTPRAISSPFPCPVFPERSYLHAKPSSKTLTLKMLLTTEILYSSFTVTDLRAEIFALHFRKNITWN